jgi:hypothetical protein
MGRITLGLASVIALTMSLALLILDWRGQSVLHSQAAERWSEVLAKFRNSRADDGTWHEAIGGELSSAYWEADRNVAKIPERRFGGLKARYLRKVALSELKSSFPGCPRLLLEILLLSRDTVNAMREIWTAKIEQ